MVFFPKMDLRHYYSQMRKLLATMGRDGARLPPKQVCQIWF
jgi:hypothetical protein